jgi:hypothetical protein
VVKHLVSGLVKRQWEEGLQVDVHPVSQCEAAPRQCMAVEHLCQVNLNRHVSYTSTGMTELTSRWSTSERLWRTCNASIWWSTAWVPTSPTGWVWDATATCRAGVWARTNPSDWNGYEPRESVCPPTLLVTKANCVGQCWLDNKVVGGIDCLV